MTAASPFLINEIILVDLLALFLHLRTLAVIDYSVMHFLTRYQRMARHKADFLLDGGIGVELGVACRVGFQ